MRSILRAVNEGGVNSDRLGDATPKPFARLVGFCCTSQRVSPPNFSAALRGGVTGTGTPPSPCALSAWDQQQLHYPQQRSGRELRSALALATTVYLQAAEPEQAAAFASDAYDIARKMARQVDQSADVGETAYLLAKARYALGRSDEAGPLLQQAVKSLGNALGSEHRLTREAGDLLARLERADFRTLGAIAK
jgi:tetratricopeptide (TPR) repeat protein